MKQPGCGDCLESAAAAGSEREAHFFVESAEMLQRLHARRPVDGCSLIRVRSWRVRVAAACCLRQSTTCARRRAPGRCSPRLPDASQGAWRAATGTAADRSRVAGREAEGPGFGMVGHRDGASAPVARVLAVESIGAHQVPREGSRRTGNRRRSRRNRRLPSKNAELCLRTPARASTKNLELRLQRHAG